MKAEPRCGGGGGGEVNTIANRYLASRGWHEWISKNTFREN